jgi:hypothetical protein
LARMHFRMMERPSYVVRSNPAMEATAVSAEENIQREQRRAAGTV